MIPEYCSFGPGDDAQEDEAWDRNEERDRDKGTVEFTRGMRNI